jgi:hypothetical protein
MRKPKPKLKDDGGIGMNNDGTLNVVAPDDRRTGRRCGLATCWHF